MPEQENSSAGGLAYMASSPVAQATWLSSHSSYWWFQLEKVAEQFMANPGKETLHRYASGYAICNGKLYTFIPTMLLNPW
jgi:hypothetical protein